jgi:hypothetical protein
MYNFPFRKYSTSTAIEKAQYDKRMVPDNNVEKWITVEGKNI